VQCAQRAPHSRWSASSQSRTDIRLLRHGPVSGSLRIGFAIGESQNAIRATNQDEKLSGDVSILNSHLNISHACGYFRMEKLNGVCNFLLICKCLNAIQF
jgi:hypothetical protein